MVKSVWVEAVEIRPITRKGVTVACKSGDEWIPLHLTVEDYRATLELATQRLHEYDAAERARVVPFRGGGARH